MNDTSVESGGVDVAMAPHFVDVSVEVIRGSATNPRKHFAQPALDELAESMRINGLAQPILLRTVVPDVIGGICLEIVAGERRWRAAKLLGWLTIPSLIRNLTDQQALELQVVENLQREDLHPLEEADGYERLILQHGYNVEGLAEKVGKSVAYVYATLKLTALVSEARTAFFDGKLNRSTALQLARMVPAVQSAAVAEVTAGDDGHPLSVRRTQDLLKSRFMLDLRVAVFDTEDPKLYPEAGPCTTCPKRTGNQHQLFADVVNTDTCTDPACFSDKKARHWARERERAAKAGREVITGEAAAEIVPQWYGPHYQRLNNDYTPVESFVAALVENGLEERVAQQTFGEILKKAKVKPVAIETRDGGLLSALSKEQHDLIDEEYSKASNRASRNRAVDDPAAREREKASQQQERERHARQKRQEAEDAFCAALNKRTLEAARVAPPTSIALLRIMVYGFWLAGDRIGGEQLPGLKKLGLVLPEEYSAAEECNLVRGLLTVASPEDLSLLMLELTLEAERCHYWEGEDLRGQLVREVATIYGIDHEALHQRLVEDVVNPPKKRTKAPAGLRYHNPATGDTWSGRGQAPKWIEGKDRRPFEVIAAKPTETAS